jgi:hypothetical protein
MKPCVNYSTLIHCEAGQRALVVPLDHPEAVRVSNRRPVLTSVVLAYDPETGEFETENTRYRPAPPEHVKRLAELTELVTPGAQFL